MDYIEENCIIQLVVHKRSVDCRVGDITLTSAVFSYTFVQNSLDNRVIESQIIEYISRGPRTLSGATITSPSLRFRLVKVTADDRSCRAVSIDREEERRAVWLESRLPDLQWKEKGGNTSIRINANELSRTIRG